MLVSKEGKYRLIFNPDRKAHWNFILRRSCFFMLPLCGTLVLNGSNVPKVSISLTQHCSVEEAVVLSGYQVSIITSQGSLQTLLDFSAHIWWSWSYFCKLFLNLCILCPNKYSNYDFTPPITESADGSYERRNSKYMCEWVSEVHIGFSYSYKK